ncbi:hypothetical protein BLL04_19780 [Klebsiella variicola]|uniref:Uncharacterized protein n=1 Tax=Klebsiella pneumoniae TaxID=573 RepID=A0A6G8FCU6_KLEPN|nr:hypothetical protein BC497_29545 [Klebsiella variicola]OUY91563.1 hypothetical protein BLL04_19780 [Klebsiella variicola]QIM13761.1 hypothetical protein [Klebsiella pneumoniae]
MKLPSVKQVFSHKEVKDFADQSTVNLTNLILLCFQTIFFILVSIFRMFFPARPEKTEKDTK